MSLNRYELRVAKGTDAITDAVTWNPFKLLSVSSSLGFDGGQGPGKIIPEPNLMEMNKSRSDDLMAIITHLRSYDND